MHQTLASPVLLLCCTPGSRDLGPRRQGLEALTASHAAIRSAVQAAAHAAGQLVDEEAWRGSVYEVHARVKARRKAHNDAHAEHQRGIAAVYCNLPFTAEPSFFVSVRYRFLYPCCTQTESAVLLSCCADSSKVKRSSGATHAERPLQRAEDVFGAHFVLACQQQHRLEHCVHVDAGGRTDVAFPA